MRRRRIENDAVDEVLLVHNPLSRKGRGVARAARHIIDRDFGATSRNLRWVELRDLPAERTPPARVVVLGGDGSVNAAAQWIHERGHDCPIAIVPAGTGNNLAKGLGIPLAAGPALRQALEGGEARKVDGILYQAGDGSQRVLVQTAALGFPAEIAARYDRLRRSLLCRGLFRPTGPYVYRWLALAGLSAQKRRERRGEDFLEVQCVLPEETLEERVIAIFIGNERSLGGEFQPCPKARIDDGLMDLCFVRAGTGESYLRLFRSVMRGEHLAFERTVVYRQTRGPVEIRLSQSRELLADGDLWVRDQRFRLEISAGRFRVIATPSQS